MVTVRHFKAALNVADTRHGLMARDFLTLSKKIPCLRENAALLDHLMATGSGHGLSEAPTLKVLGHQCLPRKNHPSNTSQRSLRRTIHKALQASPWRRAWHLMVTK